MRSRKCHHCHLPIKLKVGQTVRNYITREDGTYKCEGNMKLVEFISELPEILPFKEFCEFCRRQVNMTKEKWRVTIIDDPFLKNTYLVRNIYKFHSYGTFTVNTYNDSEDYDLVKVYCVDYLGNDPYLCAKLKREVLSNDPRTQLYKQFLEFKDNDIYNLQRSKI